VSLGFDSRGRRIRRSVYGESKQDVLAKMVALRVQPPPTNKPEPLTLTEVRPLWIAALRAEGRVRDNTIAWYESHASTHIEPELGLLLISKISRSNVEMLLAKKNKGHAELRGLLRENPMRGLRKQKPKRTGRVRIWTPGEAQRFLDTAAASPYYGVYALALGAGLRRGEIFALRWRDVDLERGTARIERGLTEIAGKFSFELPKTESGARTVALPDFAVEAIRSIRPAEPNADDLIFTDSEGNFIRRSNFDRRIHKKLIAAAKLPHRTMHELRHTHASLLLADGASIRLISSRLGHADIQTTLGIYSHLMPNAETHAAKRLDLLIRRPVSADPKAG
jgi:integrase